MSHFTCLIIGSNPEEQLEPYYELECSMNQDEMKEDPRAEFVEEFTTEELENDFNRIKNEHPEYHYDTIEEFADEYHNYTKLDGEEVWGRWTNPNSKWDWYSIGGRWTGFFKIKENPKFPDDIYFGSPGAFGNKAPVGYADSIRLCDIDFEGMKQDKITKARQDWVEIQNKLRDGDKNILWIYGIKEETTEEEYIKDSSKFSTYALIKNGEWFAKGEMGWFGVSSDDNENWAQEMETLIKSLPDDTLLTVVDCHI
jgi:hypothetical protein